MKHLLTRMAEYNQSTVMATNPPDDLMAGPELDRGLWGPCLGRDKDNRHSWEENQRNVWMIKIKHWKWCILKDFLRRCCYTYNGTTTYSSKCFLKQLDQRILYFWSKLGWTSQNVMLVQNGACHVGNLLETISITVFLPGWENKLDTNYNTEHKARTYVS